MRTSGFFSRTFELSPLELSNFRTFELANFFWRLTGNYRERSSTFSKRSSLDSPWYWFVVTEVGVGTSQSKCKFEKNILLCKRILNCSPAACSSRFSPLHRTSLIASRSTCSDLRFHVPLRPPDQRDGDILTTLIRAFRSSRSLRQHAATYAICWIALNWLPISTIEHPPRMASVME